MNPLPDMLTGYSHWNEPHTPRTHDLNHLRAKRVAYYESIGIIKNSRNGCQPLSTVSQASKVNPPDYQTFGQRYPFYLATGKKLLLQEESRQTPQEMEKPQNPRLQEDPRPEMCPEGLDLHLLADPFVSKIEKLRHVINWAQKFLSNSLEEHDLKRLQKSLELSQSSLSQSSKAFGNQKTTYLRSSDYPLGLRDDQPFNAQTDIPSFFLHPPNNFSEMVLSSEFPNSLLKEGFPVSHSCEWQEVRNEGDGRPDSPDSLQQEDFPQEKSDRAGNNYIQNIIEDGPFPERLGVLLQSTHISEGYKVLEETRDSQYVNDYFWTPLTDSSEEDLDETGESKEALRRGVVGRNYRTFSGIAFPFASNNSTLVSNCATLSGGVSSSGETSLETEVKEECRGATECPVGLCKNISVDFKVSSSSCEHLIQRQHGDQFTCLRHHFSGKRKDSDKVEIALGPAPTESKHNSDWKQDFVEGPGEAVMERVTRGESNTTAWNSAQGSPPGVVQKHFIQTHPESSLSPESASLLLDTVSEGPWDKVAPDTHLGSGVCSGLRTHAGSIGRNTWFDQLPSPVVDGRSIQAPQGMNREITHEQKETTVCSNHSISKDISKMSLKGSFPAQNGGASPSWSDEIPPTPEQGASVLETYFYYLHILNKIRGVSSEEKTSSLPFQGLSITKSESAITSPKERDRSNGVRVDRDTEEWRKENEKDVSVGDIEDTCHQGQEVMQEAALEKTKPWALQGSYGRLHSATHRIAYRMKNCGGNLEMTHMENTSHIDGAVKPRSQSIPLAEAEKNTFQGTDSSTDAFGSFRKFFGKDVPQYVKMENQAPRPCNTEHERDADFLQWLLLPDEIWICIFSLLSYEEVAQVAQVCHRFHQLASDESCPTPGHCRLHPGLPHQSMCSACCAPALVHLKGFWMTVSERSTGSNMKHTLEKTEMGEKPQ